MSKRSHISRKSKITAGPDDIAYAELQQRVLAERIADSACNIEGDQPVDIEWKVNGVCHGIEVKTIILAGDSRNRIDVSPESIRLKVEWAISRGSKYGIAFIHTVVLDHRKTYKNNSEFYSGNEIYYKRGCASHHLRAMVPCHDISHLKQLIILKDKDLPILARIPKGTRFFLAVRSAEYRKKLLEKNQGRLAWRAAAEERRKGDEEFREYY